MTDDGERNVLFVVMDTVRKDHLTPYGYDRPTTPTLESFAEEATVYEEAVAPAPWTLPVHASMFTGQYPSEHGASQEDPYLDGATTLAESLTAAGYDTACYSSNAWITPYTRLTAGFDEQDNFFDAMPGDVLSGPLARAWRTMNDNDRLRSVADELVAIGNRIHEWLESGGGSDSKTPDVIDRTASFVEESDDPWFAFVNLMDAHLPYHPPEQYREEFAPGVDSSEVCQNSKLYNCGAREIDDAEWSDIRGLYDAEIRHIDAELGRLFDRLRAAGEWEDTLVIVCADHGELHGEHDLYGHEFGLYDPIVNVPLIVKQPGGDAGRRTDQVELLDLYHTVLDHTGVEALDGGESLEPTRSLLDDRYREFDGGENAFVEYFRPVVELNQLENKASAAGIELDRDSRFYSRMRAVRQPDVKYVRNERIGDECYRLDSDPGETENLLAERAGADSDGDGTDCAELESALSAFEEELGTKWSAVDDDEVLDEMSEAARERLQDLGYVE